MAFNEETTAKRMPPLNTSATTRALIAAERCLLFRFVSLILGVICPSQTSKEHQQTTSFALRAQFNSTVAAVFNRHAHH